LATAVLVLDDSAAPAAPAVTMVATPATSTTATMVRTAATRPAEGCIVI
jgi:hypothetical protein